jgi:DNA-binding PadR family transcriptional regulator
MRTHGCGPRGRAGWPLAAMMFASGWGRGFGSGFGSDFGSGWNAKRGRGPGGRARVFGTGELRLVLLALVAQAPRHGYELIKAIEELTGGAYAPSPGVVYPTLNLLTDEGLIEELAGEGSRKAYSVTEAGQTELDQRAEEAERLLARLKAMGEEGERQSAPPIRRAVGNLFAALSSRATSGEFDRETMHQVAEILDEAARRIERL